MFIGNLKKYCNTTPQKTKFNALCRSFDQKNKWLTKQKCINILHAGRKMRKVKRKQKRGNGTPKTKDQKLLFKSRNRHKSRRSKQKKRQSYRMFLKYIPESLPIDQKQIQLKEMIKSRKLYQQYLKEKKNRKGRSHYKNKPIYVRKKTKYKNKPSKHVLKAKQLYQINSVKPSPIFASKTGCSLEGLQTIVRRGRSAYQSGGSRVNQNATSWGYARLASATTGGPASKVDYNILKNSCGPKSKALKLAIVPKRYSKKNKKLQ